MAIKEQTQPTTAFNSRRFRSSFKVQQNLCRLTKKKTDNEQHDLFVCISVLIYIYMSLHAMCEPLTFYLVGHKVDPQQSWVTDKPPLRRWPRWNQSISSQFCICRSQKLQTPTGLHLGIVTATAAAHSVPVIYVPVMMPCGHSEWIKNPEN